MAEADHTAATNSLNSSNVVRGVSAGFTVPNGGGSFVYAMRSLTNTAGAVALYTNLANFSPMANGGDVSIAMQKAGGAGNNDHSPFIFLCGQGVDIFDQAYMLGISETDPGFIELRKGSLEAGLTGDNVGTNGVLARSTNSVAVGSWVHLRLEAVVNTSGDTVLNVYENDLASNAVGSPVWAKVAGMSDVVGGDPSGATAFIDDAVGANSGSLPFSAGRGGFGARFADISRLCLFDHFTLARQ